MGLLFSRDPVKPERGQLIIQVVRGLGVSLVDGQVSPENIRVYLSPEPPMVLRGASDQKFRIVSKEDSGVMEELLTSQEALQPCLSDAQAVQLARWVLLMEDHFGDPQDAREGHGSGREIAPAAPVSAPAGAETLTKNASAPNPAIRCCCRVAKRCFPELVAVRPCIWMKMETSKIFPKEASWWRGDPHPGSSG